MELTAPIREGRRSSLFEISRPEIAATSQVDYGDQPDREVATCAYTYLRVAIFVHVLRVSMCTSVSVNAHDCVLRGVLWLPLRLFLWLPLCSVYVIRCVLYACLLLAIRVFEHRVLRA